MGKSYGGNFLKILVTGHCGFIGSNLWANLINDGHDIYGIDNLSRKISKRINHSNSVIADIIEIDKIGVLDQPFDWIIHLAAQVSVTESIKNPLLDFNTNALGTFKVVALAKKYNSKLIYSSTNKVFGTLDDFKSPILDSQPLNPKTNYGVSKCTGANYVSDYENGWVLHQSCIYGGSQIGDIDQGWIGFLRNQIFKSNDITCFGDGSQIRDLLHVQDLIGLYKSIINGEIPKNQYVAGGGEKNSFSFKQVVEMLGGQISRFDEWRQSDQRYFVSANQGLQNYGWKPEIRFEDWVHDPI
jgi:CDP-paratose 2-epimerase